MAFGDGVIAIKYSAISLLIILKALMRAIGSLGNSSISLPCAVVRLLSVLVLAGFVCGK